MPATKLFLDFDTRKFNDFSGAMVLSFSDKKDSVRQYELLIQQGGVTISLPTGTTVKAAIKKTSDPEGTLLTSADATRAGWGTGSRWFFVLDLTDDAFNNILGQVADFEVAIDLPDGQHLPSLTYQFKIEKPVIAP